MFFKGLTILSGFTNATSLNSIRMSCNSMRNQECETRPQVIMEMILCFLHLILKTSKCSGSCNNINYPYAKISVPNVAKKFKC